VEETLSAHEDVYHAGFVHDAQKEYVEGRVTLALVAGRPLPDPDDLGVSYAAYLNGLGEAVGELRRYLLDAIRRGEEQRCEELLSDMDDIYSLLVTLDFPDALTGGLRRTTDSVRGILERTRGDLTMSMRQRELEKKLAALGKE
jgi:translin